MARLSRVSSKKRVKQDATKSKFMSRMATRGITTNFKGREENMLLGDLFIVVGEDGNITDLTGNYSLDICRVQVGMSTTKKYANGSLEFNGLDNNINVKDNDNVELGIEDFSLDWWECPKPLPVPNIHFMPSLQFVMFKNSIDRKDPIIIQNDGESKHIFLSSDGDHWDIADHKYMGPATKDEWVHWALIRCNNNFYTFRNGKIKNIWQSDKVINNSDRYITIGSGPRGGYFYGHLNKIRFTRGHALWTEEFDIEEDLFY